MSRVGAGSGHIPSIGDLTARPVRDAKQGGQPGLKSGVVYIENIFIFNPY